MNTTALKTWIILMFAFFTLEGVCFANTPIYDMIGKTDQDVITTYGEPGHISLLENQDSLFTYETEIGFQSFLIHNQVVQAINTTTYWKTKAKQKFAFDLAIGFYKNDGFVTSEKTKTTATVENELYLVKIETSVMEGWHQVSETIKAKK